MPHLHHLRQATLFVLLSGSAALPNQRPWTLAVRDDDGGCSDGFIACPTGFPSAGVCVPSVAPWCESAIWRNPYATDDARVADLLPRLTLQQIVDLMQTTPVGGSNAVPELNISAYGSGECLHGYCSRTPSTLFPQSTTLAAAFNPSLVARVATAIGLEGRAWRNAWAAAGNASVAPPSLTCFSPQINIVRDPRWGRGQETYGECPFLTASLASAYIGGLQSGGGDGASYLLAAATAKHFIAYQGASTRGLHSPTEVYLSYRDMIDTFEPAWRASVAASTASVMCAYSSLCHDDTNTTCALPPPAGYGPSHGVPMCANEEMLNGWLRGGADGAAPSWDGVVAGDCGAVQFIQTDHLWVDSQPAAAAAAINAGTDFDCSISVGNGFATLVNATAAGLVNETAVRRAGGRVLRLMLQLGLFDPPELVPWTNVPPAVANSAAHRGLAAAAAREGVVLLRNAVAAGDRALPLDAPALVARGAGSVLLSGPLADAFLTGNYATETDVNVTALAGVRAYVGAAVAAHAPGCASVLSNDTSGFAAAVAAAASAAVTVAVVGLDGSVEYEDSTRGSLALPGVQDALLLALAGTGTPLVVVLVGGSGVAPSPAALAAAAAVVWAGYGGEEGGTALADVLFGAYNPAGRMPFTTYGDAADLPPYANMSMTGAPFGRTYRYFTGPAPVFRFGDGGSYSAMSTSHVAATTVAASRRRARGASFAVCDSLRVTAVVANAGPLDGDETTQVYVRLRNVSAALLPVPLQSLAGYARTALVAGAAGRALAFTLPPRAFAAVDATLRGWVVAPAAVGVYVGSNQPAGEADWSGPQAVELLMTGPPTPLAQCD